MFNPDADEEEYYNERDRAFDNEIVGVVMAQKEPSCEDDDYDFVNYNDERFSPMYNMWCHSSPIMSHEKVELEGEFFTGSDFPGNICGFNPNPERVHATVLRENKRRPT